ncbi:MAG TPA: deoxyribodipyrimidine photo-lyase, partial [Alphaproteobacteria bacterium]|nr:deoxyribodipyrimidine photo-lyase [Alphaproteobacteria bacterium]
MPSPVLCWFRQDLRLTDNPAWSAACQSGAQILPVYILDDTSAKDWKMGGASRVWLHHSLKSLNKSLNGNLLILSGNAEKLIPALASQIKADKIFWNRCYEPWRIARDTKIKDICEQNNVGCISSNGSLLWEPWEIKKQDGTPYKVFTPYFRKGCLSAPPPRSPLPSPKLPNFFPHSNASIDNIFETQNLLPKHPHWDRSMMSYWSVGETAAQKKLKDFLENKLQGYKEGRNYPKRNQTSLLSPHLHFGEISPNQIWHAATLFGLTTQQTIDLDCFQSELAWREFSHTLLYYNPTLAE